jgi:hypothetical protein
MVQIVNLFLWRQQKLYHQLIHGKKIPDLEKESGSGSTASGSNPDPDPNIGSGSLPPNPLSFLTFLGN